MADKTSLKAWLTKRQFPAWIYILVLSIWALILYIYTAIRTQ